ncbi:hypothetical protein Cgig2_034186 [Carnegiea gigantea]|uniref:Uncharacterized protein n=1 Tax=Carnegiea gigantea TaxID=171969 RepID=A0A9Q1GT36_9CARY|nr:hypothetical protein Cgig2_034186 [Carnegiea gigantea]
MKLGREHIRNSHRFRSPKPPPPPKQPSVSTHVCVAGIISSTQRTAAWLLRGTNTRTNFRNIPSGSSSSSVTANSALSLRIRNLVNWKKSLTNAQSPCQSLMTPPAGTSDSAARSGVLFDDTTPANDSLVLNQPCNTISTKGQGQMLEENLYKSELNEDGQLDYSWAFPQNAPPEPVTSNCGMSPKHINLVPDSEVSNEVAIPEFERTKVERQISASL